MTFRKIFLVQLVLLQAVICFSQTDTLLTVMKVSSSFRVALDGSLIYPGASLGIEFPVYRVDLEKVQGVSDQKMISRERFVSVTASWYHQKDFHDNLYIMGRWIMRRRWGNGFFIEFIPGLGYSRTFLGGTTYRVNENGGVDIVKLAGYSYAAVSAGGGLGYSFSAFKGLPVSVCYDLGMLTMFPYNNTIYFRPVMELGLIVRPGNFIPVKIRCRKVRK